jgi:tetratricopeptide (TPR) repeat protein
MALRIVAISLLLLCTGAVYAEEADQPAPASVSAAEAERQVEEARDFLVALLWDGTEEYWHTGRWDEAIRLCRQIVQIDPAFVEAYNGAAWMLWSMDRDEEAIELYEAGVAANPNRYEVFHDFGMYYYHRHKWDEAAEQFRESVEADAPMYYQHMLPNSLERGGRLAEALAEWRALLERFPDDPIAKRHIEALKEQLGE